MYRVVHSAFCGMSDSEQVEDRAEARGLVAARLRRLRRRGFPVGVIERGSHWEIGEPEGCALIPDACGILRIVHQTYECCECGSRHETGEGAWQCCSVFYEPDEDEEEEEL